MRSLLIAVLALGSNASWFQASQGPSFDEIAPTAPGRSLLSNGGFELGLDGWAASEGARAAGVYRNRAPQMGAKQAVLEGPARLVGAIDIPETATTLSFSATALSDGAGFEAGRSAMVWVVSPRDRRAIFDAAAIAGRDAVVEPTWIAIDVTAYRGLRVFIVAETRESHGGASHQHTLLLDEFTLR